VDDDQSSHSSVVGLLRGCGEIDLIGSVAPADAEELIVAERPDVAFIALYPVFISAWADFAVEPGS
jgi:hypothetical protein